VCQIKLWVSEWNLADVFAALEARPFPLLTDLDLQLTGNSNPIFPNPVKFLGGSTHLRSLSFRRIPVPGLPELLLSSTNLVNLDLNNISTIGFFSPRALVSALSALTKLKVLHIGLERNFDDLDWESQYLPLPPRAILPSLTALQFEGFNEYLEDLMARIDAPLLDHLNISFTYSGSYSDRQERDIELDTTQLLRFISCIPKFQAPDKAHIGLNTDIFAFWIKFSWPKQISSVVRLAVDSPYAERQVSRLVQFCHSPFFPLPTLEYLYICGGRYSLKYRQAYSPWLELLQPFTAVKNLYLSEKYARHIAPVLQELVGKSAVEVLPSLEKVFMEFRPSRCAHEAIGQFAAARRLSGHPIDIFHWDERERKQDENFVNTVVI